MLFFHHPPLQSFQDVPSITLLLLLPLLLLFIAKRNRMSWQVNPNMYYSVCPWGDFIFPPTLESKCTLRSGLIHFRPWQCVFFSWLPFKTVATCVQSIPLLLWKYSHLAVWKQNGWRLPKAQHDKMLFVTCRAAVLCRSTRRGVTLRVFLQCQVPLYMYLLVNITFGSLRVRRDPEQ